MTESNYYSDVKILKKPLKHKIKNMFKIFLIIAVVVGSYYVATCFSSALTVGNLGSFIVYGDTNVKIKAKTYWAVTLGVYDSYDQAQNVALGSTIQGASGYVWEKDNKYYVIGNIYSSLEDANKVIENINGTNYKADILEICFDKLKMNFDVYANSDMLTINDALEIFDVVYSSLYSYSVMFDKGDISHLAVSSNISNLRGELKGVIINVQNLLNKTESQLKTVQRYLVGLDEVLDQAILKTIDNTATNYSLKNAIATVIRLKYDMYQNLK